VSSKVPAIKGPSYVKQPLSNDVAKPMDNELIDELLPLPLPVDKIYNQTEYVNASFAERQSALKKKLLINGDVRIISKAERDMGVEINIPSQEGIDNWLKQSQQLGQQIRAVR